MFGIGPTSTQSWKIRIVESGFFGCKISVNKTNLITLESLSLRITYRQHCGWKKRTPRLWRLVCHFCRMYFSNTQLTEIFSEASYLFLFPWDLFWNINKNNIAKNLFFGMPRSSLSPFLSDTNYIHNFFQPNVWEWSRILSKLKKALNLHMLSKRFVFSFPTSTIT